MIFDPGAENIHIFVNFSPSHICDTLYTMGQQKRMLPIYQGTFPCEVKFRSLEKSKCSLLQLFPFPRVGLVV